ncbi:MAG: HAMP domain-containing histidine kinase [Actinobacteria bacterium]|nr:MAG: HAMP domain-containing histidine kinase [Actinomycetota bacterium]
MSFSVPACDSRIALLTPVTPTRERPMRTSGEDAWRSSVRIRDSMSSEQDTSFARLVSLACHDLRTPLATVHGFARTIARTGDLEEPTSRYVEMIETASRQLADLLDELGLAARIEAGRYEPTTTQVELGELVRAAAARLDPELGEPVTVDAPATERALAALVRCALRHGGLERVDVRLDGRGVLVSPITPSSAPVVLGEDLRDLGAAVAVRLLRRLGGSVAVEGETLQITLPGG